jgi:hypothetical protein
VKHKQHLATASLLVPRENHIPTARPRLSQRHKHAKPGQQALRNAPVLECGISHYPRMSLPRDTTPKHPHHPTPRSRRAMMMMMMMMMMSKGKTKYLSSFPCLSPSPSDSMNFPYPFLPPSLL